jgi:hypothetical protein
MEMAVDEKRSSVVLCHNGVMDHKAYVSEEIWEAALHEAGWNEISLRDKRYDGVIHLSTLAEGIEHASY